MDSLAFLNEVQPPVSVSDENFTLQINIRVLSSPAGKKISIHTSTTRGQYHTKTSSAANLILPLDVADFYIVLLCSNI